MTQTMTKTMTARWLPALAPALVALATLAATAPATANPEDILNKAGCMACHAKDKKLVGPSFSVIAAKYKGQDAAAAVAKKVREGGKGVYGPIPMPANPPAKISDADLVAAVDWILQP